MVSNAGINPVAGPVLNVSSFLDLFLLSLRITFIFFFSNRFVITRNMLSGLLKFDSHQKRPAKLSLTL